MIRTLIVDDDPFVRMSLQTILEAQDDVEVCALGADGAGLRTRAGPAERKPMKRVWTLLLAACLPVSFLGMMGDLSASVLKRNFGVKDFGKIFPGHGGVMDRFDSSMFTLPVTYALALTVFSK